MGNTNPISTLHVGDDQSQQASNARLALAGPSTRAPVIPSPVETTPAPPAAQTAGFQPVIASQDTGVPTRFLDFMRRNIVAANEDLSVARNSIRTIARQRGSAEDVRPTLTASGRARGNTSGDLPDDVKKKLQVRLQ